MRICSGKLYKVIGIAKHSETLEELVLHESLYTEPLSKFWVRPVKMFHEEVEVNGNRVPRFIYVKD